MNAQSIIPPNIDYGKISADKYSPDDTYEAGELRIQYNTLWKAKQDISVPEPWTPDHWDPTTLAAEFSALNSRMDLLSTRKTASDFIDISGYTTENPYVCPSDGYVYLLNGPEATGALHFGYESPVMAIGAVPGAFTAIVYKGWKIQINGTIGAARFYKFE